MRRTRRLRLPRPAAAVLLLAGAAGLSGLSAQTNPPLPADRAPLAASTPPVGSPRLLEPPAAVVAELLRVPPPELVIHPGDLLSVRILEVEKYDYKVRVEVNGTVDLPLVDSISVGGLRPDQASAAITERLETAGMIKRPHVYVGADEQPSQVVTVAGELQKPDVFPAAAVHTLFGAVSRAGGFKETASTTVTLVRPGAAHAYQIPLGALPAEAAAGSIPVYAGDTIVVGKLGVIYVVGAVKLSGVYALKSDSPTTVLQAVAHAGGIGYEADGKDARIVRRTESGYVELPVDLSQKAHGSESAPVLQANDILLVPTSKMKAAIKGGAAGVAVGLASAALYFVEAR